MSTLAGPGVWLVPSTSLRRTPGSQRHERRSGSLGELRVAATVVPADRDVTADVILTSIDGGIEAAGTVTAPWLAECRRCLRPVAGELVADVREIYQPASARSQAGPQAAHPQASESGDAEDEETYTLGSDHLDLAPLARDAVLLNLPLAPLCREDCAGLCPTCGAELAQGDCRCEEAAGDPRWAALDVLRDVDGADRGSTT
jgi:uncharacterized protein